LDSFWRLSLAGFHSELPEELNGVQTVFTAQMNCAGHRSKAPIEKIRILERRGRMDDNLIDALDLELTAEEISAKGLALVRSIGTAETEEAGDAIAAKARAYFKRAVALQPQRKHESVKFPLPSEIRWKLHHEGKSWGEIRDEWKALRSKIESLPQGGWSTGRIDLIQELTRLECFIEDSWPDQVEVVEVIRAERLAAEARRPPF
jgi:hypothetical protein